MSTIDQIVRQFTASSAEATPNSCAYRAMVFARAAHQHQRRKYTNQPYADHLAEVAGIVATVLPLPHVMAVAWLHDCVEDQGVTADVLSRVFGDRISEGVLWLSDLEEGNRATRKQASRKRLSRSPGWVQSIKCADVISNASSIMIHDPKFAKVYVQEMAMLLDVLTDADPWLMQVARQSLCESAA